MGIKLENRLELEFRGSIMQQMIVVCCAKGLLTLTGSEEPLKTVKQLNEVLKTFEKHIFEKFLVFPCV